ncbi:MAG: phosphate--AMP phosphotransferase [Gemmatimonadetes bacterium GWC2_71_10]|nr:MAG: phosphate--AMP phosphotransferase [Gemmatimonadetes bacterium GWC2_71_10]
MLETLDVDKTIGKPSYDKSFKPLRDRLRGLQQKCYEAKVPVLAVFEGWDASGKGDSIEKLVGRLDPRGYKVHPIYAPLEEERLRPFLWRYWTRLPGRGQIGIFDRSWYSRVLSERVEKDSSREDVAQAWVEINQFERMLADDGMVIVKFWLHISEKEQRRRFEKIEKSKYDSWRITKKDWKAHKQYDGYLAAAEEMLERTSTAHAPWSIIEATDKYFRRLKIFKTLADAMQTALDAKAAAAAAPAAAPKKAARASVSVPALREVESVLDAVDLTKKLSDKAYDTAIEKYQARLRELEFACFDARMPVIIAYEGWDAAGKGGNIRRVIGPLDPRGYSVIPIAAPKGDEATHHYLWRFWRQIPKAGHLAIFDRTWYGRVLVERIEGFCGETEWRRAYQEINEFERSLANFGTVILKFWLHISKEEQLRRFEERKATDYKRYKITDEDWRNREKWDVYREAVVDMITNTSTTYAPWTIVEANDKNWARVRTLRTIVEAIEVGLEKGFGVLGNGKKGGKKKRAKARV